MIQLGIVKILLVEDDEDDFVLTRELLAALPHPRFDQDAPSHRMTATPMLAAT